MKKIVSVILCAVMVLSLVFPVSAVGTLPENESEVMTMSSLISSAYGNNFCKYCGVKHDLKTDFWNSIYHKLLYFIQGSIFADLLTDVKNALRIKRNVTSTSLQGALGWEGDIDAPIVYVDGSYTLRGNGIPRLMGVSGRFSRA